MLSILFGIALLACYFALKRELSLGGHLLWIGGQLLYWFCPMGVLLNFLAGWGGVAVGTAVAVGFVIYNSTGAASRDPDAPLPEKTAKPRKRSSRRRTSRAR